VKIYRKEARPTDEWQTANNENERVCHSQPRSLEQRVALAGSFAGAFENSLSMHGDDVTNAADEPCAGWPERLYAMGADGKIGCNERTIPFGYEPSEVEEWFAGAARNQPARPVLILAIQVDGGMHGTWAHTPGCRCEMLTGLLAFALAAQSLGPPAPPVQDPEPREPPVEPWFGPGVKLVRTIRGTAYEHLGAALAAAGDLDGDGLADLALIGDMPFEDAAGPRPSESCGLYAAGVRGTRRLAILHGSQDGFDSDADRGQRLAALGDLDGDGRFELLASAVSWNGGGRVWLVSGATGRTLRTWPEDGVQSTSEYGATLARIGDLDGDGRAEFRVDACLYSGASFERAAPHVRALLQLDESRAWVEACLCEPVLQVEALASSRRGVRPNYFVFPDVGEDLYLEPQLRMRKHPFLIVSGADARVLGSWTEERLDFERIERRAIGDWDGDGIGELWVARVRSEWPARVEAVVRSGTDAHVLATIAFPREDFGAQVCVIGDSDGNGRAELAVGAPDFRGYEKGGGAVFLFELAAK
jgi:hypothetical protein